MLWLVLLCTYILLRPSLTGYFIFDDYPNLEFLGRISATTPWQEWWGHILSGTSSTLGRPVAVTSFAWQYPSWPRYPGDLIQVNILLHLLNGCLLLWLMLRLGEILTVEKKHQLFLALSATTLWLLHPIQVSTVAYIVQRMAELSALFTLLALLAYLHGRALVTRRLGRGYAWMSFGMVVFGTLAVLSKENGVLLPAFVLVLETTLLQTWREPRGYAVWRTVFLYLPLLLLLGYFATNFQTAVLGSYAIREFSLTQRLLTEPVILLDYLNKIVLPRPSAFDFYYDDYPISLGLLNPPFTIVAICMVSVAIVAAIAIRRRHPLFSFAALWFFTGHALESSFLPLELYFEHRNYLPLIGPCLALAYLALQAWDNIKKPAMRSLLLLAGSTYLGLLAAMTWGNATLWGNPLEQALVWRQAHPQSIRTGHRLAEMWRITNNFQEAARVYAETSREHPDQVGGDFLWLELGCLDNAVTLPDHTKMLAKARVAKHSFAPVIALNQIVKQLAHRQCGRLTSMQIRELIETLLTNPRFNALQLTQANLYLLLGRLHALERHLNPAMAALDHIHALGTPRPDIALMQANWLVSAQLYDDALRYVQLARKSNARLAYLRRSQYQSAIESMEHSIQQMKSRSATTTKIS